MHDTGKYFVAIACLVSFVVFLLVFTATFVARPALEDALTGFVRSRVQQEVRERVGSVAGADAAALQRWFDDSATSAADFLANDLEPLVNYVVDSLCGLDCEEQEKDSFRDKVRGAGQLVLGGKVDAFNAISTQLKRFIRGKYLELVRALLAEVRIFSGINAALFAFVLGLLVAKWNNPKPVFLPATLLLVATATCALLYIFQQNWFLSIFLQDYSGYWYLAYVAVVFGFLVDVAFNRARVTKAVLDVFSSALASA